MSEEADDTPPELRRPYPPDQRTGEEATTPGSNPPEELTIEELQEQLAAEQERADAERAEKEYHIERASQMEEAARRHTSELAQAKGEIAQMGDTIQGLFRSTATSWDGSVHIAMTAWQVTRDMDGFVRFLKGPTRNWWPYIIFGAGILIASIILVEVPYIAKSPTDLALVVLVVGFFFLIAYWQSRR